MDSQKQSELRLLLETQGLLVALEQLKKEVAETCPIPIHLEADQDIKNLLSQVAPEPIFSIIAEAVANACKHAQADHLYLRLYQRGTTVIVEVEDDGLGFDVAQVKADYAEAWHSLEARAALVKGKFDVQSAPGTGTKVRLIIPVDVGQTTFEA